MSESEVKAEAESGRLVGRAVGSDWRFAREELFRWLKPVRSLPQTTPVWNTETEAECEREIAASYAARPELGTVGDHFTGEGDE